MFCFPDDEEESIVEDDTPDYPVNLFFTKEGYFKKITPQSLRMSGEQKLKEGDSIECAVEATNKTELLFFTDKARVYKTTAAEFPDTKASVMGEYVPVKLSFESDENVFAMVPTTDYEGFLIAVFENGKTAKIPLSSYATKTNRKRLTSAYSDKSPPVKLIYVRDNADIALISSRGRMVIFNTALILPKAARDTIGVQTMTLKSGAKVEKAWVLTPEELEKYSRYYVKNVPVTGLIAKGVDDPDQLTL